MPEWEILIEDDLGETIRFPIHQESISIGRDSSNAICLNERNVSRRHGRIIIENDQFFIEDLNSYNGILLKSKEVNELTPFIKGDLIEVGDFHLVLQLLGEETNSLIKTIKKPDDDLDSTGQWDMEDEHSHETRTEIEESVLSSITPGLPSSELNRLDAQNEISPFIDQETEIDKSKDPMYDIASQETEIKIIPEEEYINFPRLMAISTTLAGNQYILNQKSMIAGRLRDNDLVIEHKSASRNHAKFYIQSNGDARVIDLRSANGVLVNGVEIDEAILMSGDIIELGRVFLRFVPAGEKFSLSQEQIETAHKEDLEQEDFSPADQMTAAAFRLNSRNATQESSTIGKKKRKKWPFLILFLLLISVAIAAFVWTNKSYKNKIITALNENFNTDLKIEARATPRQTRELIVTKKIIDPLPFIKQLMSSGKFIEAMDEAEKVDQNSEFYEEAMQLWSNAQKIGCDRYFYLASEFIPEKRFKEAAEAILKMEQLDVSDARTIQLRKQLNEADKNGVSKKYFRTKAAENTRSNKKTRRRKRRKKVVSKTKNNSSNTPIEDPKSTAKKNTETLVNNKKEQATLLYKKSQSMLAAHKCVMVHALAQEAERISPSSIPEFWFLKAKCYEITKDTSQAISAYKKYIKIGHQTTKITQSKSALESLKQ